MGITNNEAPLSQSVSLIVPRTLVKTVKSVLEARGYYDKNQKIQPMPRIERSADDAVDLAIISTTKPLAPFRARWFEAGTEAAEAELFRELELTMHAANIKLARSAIEQNSGSDAINSSASKVNVVVSGTKLPGPKNLLERTIRDWLASLPRQILSVIGVSEHGNLVLSIGSNTKYMIYHPMLLLPPQFFSAWPAALLEVMFPRHAESLYTLLCKAFHVTHIAINGLIPSTVPFPDITAPSPGSSNILRSPTNFTPLHGSFGPFLSLSHHPNISDFDQAFWCTTRQNSILQTWAPRYTMFSRGNISEKARILNFSSLTEERLGCPPGETSAVDLYAGVGYFSFSYARAGVGKVLCWEINPWSVEGLRRGARGNGWGVKTFGEGDSVNGDMVWNEKCVVFEESHEFAAKRTARLRVYVPSIRHVNCGFLPSSRDSWRTAVGVLDPVQGGWIHAHELTAKNDMERRIEEMVHMFNDLVEEVHGLASGIRWEVSFEHVEQVKSYAPGVMHIVLDVAIAPIKRLL
ncbi:MAG: hypothetical protein Q9217_003487 [Psora testacea]